MKFKNIQLKADGTWMHDGVEITHEKTVQLLKKSIYFEKGQYYLTGEKIPVPVDVEDVAFFVTGLSKKKEGFQITLSDGSIENLDPVTLNIGKNHGLYCRIKKSETTARFERKVYNELLKDLDEKDGYYGLIINNLFYPVHSKKEAKAYEQSLESPKIQKKVKKAQTKTKTAKPTTEKSRKSAVPKKSTKTSKTNIKLTKKPKNKNNLKSKSAPSSRNSNTKNDKTKIVKNNKSKIKRK